MPRVFTRPDVDRRYPATSLGNSRKYEILTNNREPASKFNFDDDFNYILDAANLLSQDIDGVVAGVIPGSDAPGNFGKFLTPTGGGLEWGLVDTDNIVDSAITADKLADGAGTTPFYAEASVPGVALQPNSIAQRNMGVNSVGTAQIWDRNITQAKMANNSVGTPQLIDGNVTQVKLANNSVGTFQIRDLNIIQSKMAPNSVGTSQLIDANVTQAKMAAGSVGSAQILSNTVSQSKMQASSIGTSQLINANVTQAKMANNSVGAPQLIDASVGTAQLANAAVTQGKLADSSVGTAELIDGNVTQVKLANNSVGTSQLINANVTQAKMANNSVGAPQLIDASVGTAQLANAAVTQGKLADSSVGTAELIDGNVTIEKLATVIANRLLPIGGIMIWPTNNPGFNGWLDCNGQAVSRVTYLSLFQVLGTAYGPGDGATTFNVPDLRGRAVFGVSNGSTQGRITTATANVIAESGVGGFQTIVLDNTEIPAHTHSYSINNKEPITPGFGSNGLAAGNNQTADQGTYTNNTAQSQGGGQAHNNMPPFMLMKYFIRAL